MGNNIKKGFTLIELLVTIGIIAILTIVAVPNFAKYRNINDLNNAARLVQSEIYKARNLALAPATDKNPKTYNYKFQFSPDKSKMQISETGIDEKDLIPVVIDDEINLPKNISISCNDVTNCFNSLQFSIKNYGRISDIVYDVASNNIDDINNSITIKSSKVTDVSKKITVNRVTGQVTIETINDTVDQ